MRWCQFQLMKLLYLDFYGKLSLNLQAPNTQNDQAHSKFEHFVGLALKWLRGNWPLEFMQKTRYSTVSYCWMLRLSYNVFTFGFISNLPSFLRKEFAKRKTGSCHTEWLLQSKHESLLGNVLPVIIIQTSRGELQYPLTYHVLIW